MAVSKRITFTLSHSVKQIKFVKTSNSEFESFKFENKYDAEEVIDILQKCKINSSLVQNESGNSVITCNIIKSHIEEYTELHVHMFDLTIWLN